MLTKRLFRVRGLSWCQWKRTVQQWTAAQICPQNSPVFFPITRRLASQATSDLSTNNSHPLPSDSSNSVQSQHSELSEKGIGRSQDEQKFKLWLKPDHPEDAKILRVAIIGLPNSGKSTLTNNLMGWRVSTVSKKVHTTRKNTTGICTHGSSQIVFLDTPGILSATSRKKHNLERSLLIDPERSLHQAHLVCVLVDVSNKWMRNELDPLILQTLHLHQQIPAVLILNKVDLLRSKETLLQMARSLTQGIVDGRPLGIINRKIRREQQRLQKEALFDAMDGRSPQTSPGTEPDQGEVLVVEEEEEEASVDQPSSGELSSSIAASEDEAWASYFQRMRGARRAVQGMKGWPLFKRVFMVSALSGDGVDDLKDYLLQSARPGDWDYHSSLVTSQDPRELVLLCVKEKLLEHLHQEVPYNISLDIVLWEVDEDGMFNVIINATTQTRRQVSILLGPKGLTIQKIASEAKQEMMNAFRCEMRLKIVARCRPKPSHRR